MAVGRALCAWWLLIGLASCRQLLGIDDPTIGGSGGDAASVGDGTACYGSLVSVCLATTPASALVLASGTVDTDSDTRCSRGPAGACVLAAQSVSVLGTVIAIGSAPLIVLGTDSVSVPPEGTLDVSSHGSVTGAGTSPAACQPSSLPDNGTGTTGSGEKAAGGGAGGTFGAVGGAGGMASTSQVASSGGAPAAMVALTGLRAGCPGGAGGSGGPTPGGAGGAGGGAIYVIAGGTIGIDGRVLAMGAGGRGGGMVGAGGGGGGAGGLVALEAPNIDVNGTISANGGAGGGAGGATAGGTDGGDGSATIGQQALGGSAADAQAGAGGNGTTASVPSGPSGSSGSLGGGGGGGGSVGIVWVKGALTGSQISPNPTLE